MTFWRRFRLYLVGVGLGLLLSWIFFARGERPSWTPEGRVLLTIDSSQQYFSQRAECQLKCLEISAEDLSQIQNVAEVNFKESNTRKEPCPVYHMKSEFKEDELQLIWEVCKEDERVELLSVTSAKRSCDCG